MTLESYKPTVYDPHFELVQPSSCQAKEVVQPCSCQANESRMKEKDDIKDSLMSISFSCKNVSICNFHHYILDGDLVPNMQQVKHQSKLLKISDCHNQYFQIMLNSKDILYPFVSPDG